MSLEMSEEQRLVDRLQDKSRQWAREFLRGRPNGTLKESIEWLKELVNRPDKDGTRELASILIKAYAGPESGVISVPFPGSTSEPGVWSEDSRPEYPAAIWQKALNEAHKHMPTTLEGRHSGHYGGHHGGHLGGSQN
jgi:hypothetical protein